MTHSFVNVKLMHDVLHQQVCTTWNQYILNVDKWRTYITFKQEYGTEHYVKVVTNRQHNAALSQFKCGVLPLKVERFQDIHVEHRLCTMCEEKVIETESHFLLYCSKYNQLRYKFFTNLKGLFPFCIFKHVFTCFSFILITVMMNLSSLY